MSESNPIDALRSLFGCLQNTFKKHSRSARRKAWDSLLSGKGKEEVNKLLNSPSHQVTGVARFLKFKEWLAQS